MSKRVTACGLFVVLFFAYAVISPSTSYAETISSPSYKFEESTLGAGGLPNSASSNYRATTDVGDLAGGDSASANYQSRAGTRTTNDPNLSVTVNSSGISFGQFSPSTPVMGTATFSVKNYTSYGYVVIVAGPPPTTGNHPLVPISPAGASSPGFEQFGINLVANTSPQTIGANVDNGSVPNNFGLGAAYTNYATANKYYYSDGDTIAGAPKSSGVTNYTISYLANVSSLTPGGTYTTNQSLIVVGTY